MNRHLLKSLRYIFPVDESTRYCFACRSAWTMGSHSASSLDAAPSPSCKSTRPRNTPNARRILPSSVSRVARGTPNSSLPIHVSRGGFVTYPLRGDHFFTISFSREYMTSSRVCDIASVRTVFAQ